MPSSKTPEAATRRPVVVKGRLEPLGQIPFHSDGPLTRWIMASADLDPSLGCYVAIHRFTNVSDDDRDYCHVHVHEYDEINIFHTDSALRMNVLLGDETIEVDAPSTVFIPAGTPHATNVKSGSGFMVAVLFDGTFRATKGT